LSITYLFKVTYLWKGYSRKVRQSVRVRGNRAGS